MHTLTWPQVHAWRLAQHGLNPRFPADGILHAARVTGGIQAQVLSAAEMALGARVDGLMPDTVQAALWQERTLVKTWQMRGTLHLMTAEDLPLFCAARQHFDHDIYGSYLSSYGIQGDDAQAYKEALPRVLRNGPLTRQEVAEAIGTETGLPALRDLILNANWGMPLKEAAFRGELCFGPSQGQNVTFVHPRTWLPTWTDHDPAEALKTVTRRYLNAYGPTNVYDFRRWWGTYIKTTKAMLDMLGDELVEVEVEGWQGVALRETMPALAAMEPRQSVRLLPLFDAYTLGLGKEVEAFIAKEHQARVYRQQGWVSAVVLVDGAMRGVWTHKARRKETTLTVTMFEAASKAVRSGIEAEAERWSAFWGCPVQVVYAG